MPAQGKEIDKIFTRATLADRRKLHACEIFERGERTAGLRPENERAQETIAKLKEAHPDSSNGAIQRAPPGPAGDERDPLVLELASQLQGLFEEGLTEPIKIDGMAMPEVKSDRGASGEVEAMPARHPCKAWSEPAPQRSLHL
jgi:hypothetical protein